jgi:hypothetical protein
MASQDFVPPKGFSRRVKEDGTVDCICLFCFASVAYLPSERALENVDPRHFCWQRMEYAREERQNALARRG